MSLLGSSTSLWDSPEIMSYRHAHQESIESVLGDTVNLVFLERPPNPIQFIVRHLVEHSGAYAGPPDLQAEIEQLRARNESLATENERLTTALAEASATKPEAKAEEPRSKPAVGQLTRQQSAAAQLAETAGVIAVGSRVHKGTYEQPMKEWAESADALLPKQVLLNTSTAAIQALAPCYLAHHKERKQVEELKAALEALKDAGINQRTRVEYQLAEAEKREKKAGDELTAAEARVGTVTLEAAAAISPGLARDGEKYSAAVTEMMEKEPGLIEELTKEAATAVNHGAVEVGEEVEAVVDGKMARAQVRRADAKQDEYELSLWTEVIRQKYEAGFDTREPKLITVPRREVYANRKHKQTLSPEALALAKSRAEAEAKARGTPVPNETAPKRESPEYLSLLYLDAERALPSLHDLGGEITKALPDVEPIVAPLKGEARACFKTVDKYGGDARRLADIARMTIKCPTLRAALAALRFLAKHGGFVIVLIKNRLTLAFDASATGGYRDLLLNLEIVGSKHIVEVQITLTPLLAIKAGGGHAAYQIARVHGFFEKKVNRHEGALSADVLEKLRCGMLRELVCIGKSVGLAAHFEALLAALRAPSCQVRELRLYGCEWPEGRALSELVDALPAHGLKTLDMGDMQVGGALHAHAALFDKCAEAELVALTKMALTGSIPANVGKCTKLKILNLHNNQLEGAAPASELAKLTALEYLVLVQNEALTITASGKQEIQRAAPEAQFWWPRVVNA